MYSRTWLHCYSVISTSTPFRSAIVALSMNTPNPIIGSDPLDRLPIENLSLKEPQSKSRQDRAKRYKAKKRQLNARLLNKISQGVPHEGPHRLGALKPILSPVPAPKNRVLVVPKNSKRHKWRINKASRYSTSQASSIQDRDPQNTSKPNQPPNTLTATTLSNSDNFSTLQPPTVPSEEVEQDSTVSVNFSTRALNRDELQHLPAPPPTTAYLSLSSSPKTLSTPQRLLLVLDLNGTLVYRSLGSTVYKPRPWLSQFLDYCIANHTVLVWSSAMPRNVVALCNSMFRPEQRKMVLGIWARNTLGLTPQQYRSRVQVYKRLDRIWDDPKIALKHPESHLGARWTQKNTLLIDDSIMKASAQPYNLVQIPEFTNDSQEKKGKNREDFLGQVVAYLEEARKWDNVSAFVRERKFVFGTEWSWDWQAQKKVVETVDSEDEDEDGGVKLPT